jgi:Reverse transcriptase (RNA-dependent DNA polymerase)
MAQEISALAHNKTWILVPPSLDQHVIGSKWVFKVKRHSDGSIERHKARLIARGFLQQEGVDFNDTFSPVVRLTIIQVILSLVVSQQWPIRQLDVHNVFLHGDLKEQVFMSQPSGFIDQTKPNHVCLLSKSIYGLKQSPRS